MFDQLSIRPMALSRFRRIAVYLLFTIAVVACGGGGGSNGGGGGTTPGTSAGVAAKGIIKQGNVVAEELDSNGIVIRQVGSATTDNSGAYTLTMSGDYAGGPVRLSISATPGTTVMACDVSSGCGAGVNFGDDFELDANFLMTAMISGISAGSSVTTQITPFTHMAAQRALESAVLDANAVTEANSEVSNLLGGLDILTIPPVDLTNAASRGSATNSQQLYAAMGAAVGQLAFDGSGDINDAIDVLAASFSGGTIVAEEDAGSPDDSSFSLQEIIDATTTQLQSLALSDSTGVLNNLQADVESAGIGGVIDPGSTPNAGDTDIQQAKALVEELRTWGTQIAALENPAAAFSSELLLAGVAVEPFADALGSSFIGALELGGSTLKADLDNGATGGAFPYDGITDFDEGVVTPGVGTVTITRNSTAGTTLVEIVGTFSGETVDLDVTVPSIGVSATTFAAMIVGSVENSSARLTIAEGEVNGSASDVITPNFDAPSNDPNLFTSGSFSLDVTLEQLGVSEPVSFSGDLVFGAVRVAPGDSGVNVSNVTASGTFSNSSNSFVAVFSATLNNATTFDRTLEESAGNFADITVSMTLTANLTGVPALQVTVTGNRTGYDSAINEGLGNGSVIIAHDGVTVRIDAVVNASTGTGSLTFTNQDDVVLTVDGLDGADNPVTGTLQVGGVTVGTVSEIADGIFKVSYSDGTFETLN